MHRTNISVFRASVITMAKRVLLLSSSRVYGSGYLDYAEQEVKDFLGTVQRLLFVPYALKDLDGYSQKAVERFERMGYRVHSIHQAINPKVAIAATEALFVGGGNTFRLLKMLQDQDLLEIIRARVEEGMLYIGSSAGLNIAAPTIRTTNDMPIVEPRSLNSLGLVSFQINPHYLDPEPNSKHMGETREERLLQFHEENETPVVALREGAWLRIEDDSVLLKGLAAARIFRRGMEPVEVNPPSNLIL